MLLIWFVGKIHFLAALGPGSTFPCLLQSEGHFYIPGVAACLVLGPLLSLQGSLVHSSLWSLIFPSLPFRLGQGHLSISKTELKHIIQKPFCHVTRSQVPGVRVWPCLADRYSACHRTAAGFLQLQMIQNLSKGDFKTKESFHAGGTKSGSLSPDVGGLSRIRPLVFLLYHLLVRA